MLFVAVVAAYVTYVVLTQSGTAAEGFEAGAASVGLWAFLWMALKTVAPKKTSRPRAPEQPKPSQIAPDRRVLTKPRRRDRFIRRHILTLLRRDGGRCGICGRPLPLHPRGVHIDHIKPWSHGGSDHVSNLQLTHARCNLSKRARNLPSRGPRPSASRNLN